MACRTRAWGLTLSIGIGAMSMLLVAGCGDSGDGDGTGASGGTPSGTGGTGATGGFVGCRPCDDQGVELANNGCDDNCDGFADEVRTCDATLVLDSAAPVDGARAMDLCRGANGPTDWGVTSVSYALPAGESPPAAQMIAFDFGHGILSAFGAGRTPRSGLQMLALSSGAARDVDDPGYQPPSGFDKGYMSTQPTGFPPNIPACGATNLSDPHDGIALQVELRVPPNASAFAFDFAFYSADFPNLVCSDFSDIFAVLLDPPAAGTTGGNLVFDEDGNPITANTALLESCDCEDGPPCDAGGLVYSCALGPSLLESTGFDDNGATGWLTTKVPVQSSSEIRLRFAIWDSGDGSSDSTVLIDNFRWVEDDGAISTVQSE